MRWFAHTSALFPSGDLTAAERGALAIAVSVAVSPMLGLALSFSPMGLEAVGIGWLAGQGAGLAAIAIVLMPGRHDRLPFGPGVLSPEGSAADGTLESGERWQT